MAFIIIRPFMKSQRMSSGGRSTTRRLSRRSGSIWKNSSVGRRSYPPGIDCPLLMSPPPITPSSAADTALRMAAQSLHRSTAELGDGFGRLKAKLGTKAAVTATAHKLARILWAMIKYCCPYQPSRLGNPELTRARKERYLNKSKLKTIWNPLRNRGSARQQHSDLCLPTGDGTPCSRQVMAGRKFECRSGDPLISDR